MLRFLLLTLAAAGVLTGCQPSESAGRARRLKLAYVMAPGGPAHKVAAHFADLVSKKDSGRDHLELYPDGAVGQRQGVGGESGHWRRGLGARGHGPDRLDLPEYGAIEAPFIFRDYEHLDHVLRGAIGQEIVEAFATKRQTVVLDWWTRGPRYLTTSNRRVVTPADLKGLRLARPNSPPTSKPGKSWQQPDAVDLQWRSSSG